MLSNSENGNGNKARWRVLLSAPYMQPVVEEFRPVFAENGVELIVPPVNERLEESDLLGLVADVDGVICGDDRFTEAVLRAAPRLKVISKWGTGVDSIDKAACAGLGIALCNTPNAFSEPVADTVLGYVLSFARNLPWMDRHMKDGVWHKVPGRALRECTLGIIGVGNVGRAVARRAAGFGVRLLGNDPLEVSADLLRQTGLRMVSLDELLAESDFVSVNCDLNQASHHLLSDDEFARAKPGAVVINTARGPIIDEAALIRALEQGRIAGAALDVFEVEPLPDDSPLRGMDNVLLAPHNSNSSPGAWQRVHLNTINNLLAELRRRDSR
jgi:D-3-phosphoglycerate dehydrogenase / 2-oxoglutarate reductase